MNGFENVAKLAMNSKTAGSVKEAVGTRDAILEPKYDGIRLLVHVTEENGVNRVHAYARSGNSKTGKLPAIEAEIAENFPPGTWIDGEAVAFNTDGTQDWGGAQSVLGSSEAKAAQRSGTMKFVVFDILAHGGIDARSLSFRLRRQLLNEIWEGGNFTLCQLSVQQDATDENHEANLEAGFEGSMVKHLDASYQSGKRAACSLKLKSVDTVDAVITGFKPGKPDSWIARAGMVGAITFEHYTPDGTAVQGACSGMTVPLRREITDAGDTLIGQVMEVSYMTRMPGGSLRHPQFKRLRTDKTAAECRA